jgi:hypothetical protein
VKNPDHLGLIYPLPDNRLVRHLSATKSWQSPATTGRRKAANTRTTSLDPRQNDLEQTPIPEKIGKDLPVASDN